MNKPLAIASLISYRYRGTFGWIAIGAKDDEDAFREAARSTSAPLQPENLEIWNETCQMYAPALKPLFETGDDTTGCYIKVLEMNGLFKVVVYDADGDVCSARSCWMADQSAATAYAQQLVAREAPPEGLAAPALH